MINLGMSFAKYGRSNIISNILKYWNEKAVFPNIKTSQISFYKENRRSDLRPTIPFSQNINVILF